MLLDKIKEKWNSFAPGRKRNAVVSLVVIGVLVTGIIGYKISRAGKPNQPIAAEKKKDISLEPELLKKSMYMESQKERTKLDEKISSLQKQIEEIKKQKEETKNENIKDKPSPGRGLQAFPPIPPPPPQSVHNTPQPPGPRGQPNPPAQPQIERIGGIKVFSNQQPKEAIKDSKEQGSKKKENQGVYLSPSFMEATLLSGLDAPTVEGAKGNPVPVLLRIKDLAVLPNSVKANLKGCFVIAEGHGNLADERVHLRLVSLSCIAKNGQAVIDQKVKGVVIDEDGKIGLRGKVVSKMGSAIARSVLAGFFGGAGDAIKAAATTTSISPLGTTQTIQTGDVLKAGVGSGIAQGAHDLQKFYLDLAKQTMPVIEVGATKTVTLIVSEGVELLIKEICVGGGKCNE